MTLCGAPCDIARGRINLPQSTELLYTWPRLQAVTEILDHTKPLAKGRAAQRFSGTVLQGMLYQ